MRTAILVFAVLFCCSPLGARQNNPFGVGVILGEPTGLTAKYLFNQHRAIDFGLGFSSDFKLYADYIWHMWDVFPQPQSGKLALYLATGPRFEENEKDNKFGIRTIVGVDYWLDKHPFEFFFELGPVFQLSPETGTDFDAGIGVRYYFGKGN